MATKRAQARVHLGVNDKPLVEGLKDAAKKFGAFAVGANQALELVGKVAGFVAGSIGKLVSVTTNLAKAASEAEKAELRFLAAAQRRGEFTREQFELLQKSNAARQQALGIDGEEQLNIQTQLSAMGVRNDALDEATRLTIGLAEVTGSYDSAAKLVARTLQGQTSALSQYGITAKDTADAQRQINELYAIAEAKGRTLETRVKVLNENWGDFLETLGMTITKSPALIAFIDTLSENVRTLTDFVADEQGKRDIETFFKLMFDGATLALSATTLLAKSLHGLSNIGTLARLKEIESEVSDIQAALQKKRDIEAGVSLTPGFDLAPEESMEQLLDRLTELQEEHARLSKRAAEGTFADISELAKRLQQQFLLAKAALGEAGGAGGGGGRKGRGAGDVAGDKAGARSTGAIGTSVFRDEVPAEFLGIFGPLSSDELRTLSAETTRIVDETRAELDAIQDRWLSEQRSALVEGIQTERDAVEARKAIADTEIINAEERARLLAEIDQKQLDFSEQAAQRKIQLADTAAQYVATSLTSLIQQAVEGEQNLGQIMRKIFGGLLTAVGSSLVSLGVAAVAGGLVGSVAPWLSGVTGAKGAIAAGAAATAIGAGLVAAGAALSAGGRPKAPSAGAAAASAGGGGTFRTPSFRGPSTIGRTTSVAFQAPLRGDTRPIVYNIQFGSGPAIVGGDPRRVARDVSNWLANNLGPLQPAGGR